MFYEQFRLFLIRFKNNLVNGGGIPMQSFLATFSEYYQEGQRKDVAKYLDKLNSDGIIDFKILEPNFQMIILTSKGHFYFDV